ncbi:trithorax group protein osa-like [Ursus maritimus]|uniref:Trithorax group protein osa-like n=1 Tax=Ursus maritimus TaxID=29073 RepID=A0A8M1GRZ9_URSMA|nr:trithorax group protein osa-like [Ursus maritimus]
MQGSIGSIPVLPEAKPSVDSATKAEGDTAPPPRGPRPAAGSGQRRSPEPPGDWVLRGQGSAENGGCSRPGGPGRGSEEPQSGLFQQGAPEVQAGFRRVWGSLCSSGGFGPWHYPAHSKDSTGKALGPENREVPPAEAHTHPPVHPPLRSGPPLGAGSRPLADPSQASSAQERLGHRRLPPEPVARYCCNLRTKAGGEEGARRGGDEIPLSAVPLPPGSDPRLPRTRPGLRLALPFDPRLVEPRAPQPRPSPALTLPRARGQSSGHPDRTEVAPRPLPAAPPPRGPRPAAGSGQRRSPEPPGDWVLRGQGSAENGGCSRPGGPGRGSEEPQSGLFQQGAPEVQAGFRRVWGSLCSSGGFGPWHYPAHSKDSTGKALGPENREVPPAEAHTHPPVHPPLRSGPPLGAGSRPLADPSQASSAQERLGHRRLPPEPVARYCCNLRTKAGGEEGARRGGDEIPLSAVPLPPGSDPRLPRTRPGLRLALPFDPRLVEPRAPQPRPSPALTLPRARGQSSGHPDRTEVAPRPLPAAPPPRGPRPAAGSGQRRSPEPPGDWVLRGQGSAENGGCSRPGGPGRGSEEPQSGLFQQGAPEVQAGFRRVWGSLCSSGGFGPWHYPAHSKDSTGKALGPENREVPPAEAHTHPPVHPPLRSGPPLGAGSRPLADPSQASSAQERLGHRRLPPEPVARYCCNLRTKAGGEEGARRGGDEIPLSAVPLPPGSDPRLPRTRPGLRLALPFDPRLVEPRAPQPRPSPALTLPRARGQSSGHPDRTVTTP